MKNVKYRVKDDYKLVHVSENDNLLEVHMLSPEIVGYKQFKKKFDEMFECVVDAEIVEEPS